MPNTIAYADNEIQITFDGATAWNPGMVFRVVSFEFLPSANGDSIRVRESSASGATRFYQKASLTEGVTDQRKGYEHGYKGRGLNITPYIVGNEASANSTLIIKYA